MLEHILPRRMATREFRILLRILLRIWLLYLWDSTVFARSVTLLEYYSSIWQGEVGGGKGRGNRTMTGSR